MTPHEELTWAGHATVLFDVGGFRILTDPAMTRRLAHLRRRRPLPSRDIGDVDLVLLSHAHMDHLHLPSLRRVRPTARIVAPAGTAPLLRAAGHTGITEVVVGDRVEVGPVTVEVVPAAHKSGRGPHSRVAATPVGFIVDTGSQRYYFAGDTDLFDGMADLHDIDVALLPIWGWGPTIGNGHLDPTRAASATALIQPRLVVPMHWGTYAPEDGRLRVPPWFHDPIERFDEELASVGETRRLHVVEPGDTLTLPPAEDPPDER